MQLSETTNWLTFKMIGKKFFQAFSLEQISYPSVECKLLWDLCWKGTAQTYLSARCILHANVFKIFKSAYQRRVYSTLSCRVCEWQLEAVRGCISIAPQPGTADWLGSNCSQVRSAGGIYLSRVDCDWGRCTEPACQNQGDIHGNG